MKLRNISLKNFRNHILTEIECSPEINLLLGDNGEGKTNIIEGISYILLSKSFFSNNDKVVVRKGEECFATKGSLVSDRGFEYEVSVEFNQEREQKSVTVNKGKIEKFSSLIGRFPVVILSPEQSEITFGSPVDRRKFVDFVVSQSNKTYLENLIEYRKILKQRNKNLMEIKATKTDKFESIEPWNESLMKTGASIMKKRMEFIKDFQEIMMSSYTQLSGKNEWSSIAYSPSFECASGDKEEIINLFAQALKDRFTDEYYLGHSLVGPQRDDFNFYINDLHIKNHASQGQHKTFLVALKLAEFSYLKSRCCETPILLLDDVFSELDRSRAQRLLEAVAELGQIFITSTDEHSLDGKKDLSVKVRKFLITQGKIIGAEDRIQVN